MSLASFWSTCEVFPVTSLLEAELLEADFLETLFAGEGGGSDSTIVVSLVGDLIFSVF